MDSLPVEILWHILSWDVRMCRCEKNTILPLRLVCKAFDIALKPFIFKTVQLEFSKFLRHEKTPSLESLERVGSMCEALYLDLMVVRDEEEIIRLSNVFQSLISKVPQMVPLLDDLRRYCMNDTTFDETDFHRVLENVLFATPNMHRVKLNLPFQVVGQRSRTATLLLATTLNCLARRAYEYRALQTLVIDHVSDTTLIDICHNPMDLANAIKVFTTLKHLVLSIKRQEAHTHRQETFNRHLGFLIRKAICLESLCLVGWNVKRDINTRRHVHGVSPSVWNMRSLPLSGNDVSQWQFIRCLELKRVDINPHSLLSFFRETAQSLREVFLNEVYLKIRGSEDENNLGLWIGLNGIERPSGSCWLARDMRDLRTLQLDVLRVTGLGYDDFQPDPRSTHPDYDLIDPLGLERSFDQRFVDEVILGSDTLLESTLPTSSASPLISLASDVTSYDDQSSANEVTIDNLTYTPKARVEHNPHLSTAQQNPRKRKDYDAETYQRFHNTTSHFKRCIDGHFFNHNEQALKELQNIITVADRGMILLSAEIERSRTEDLGTLPGT